MRDKLKSYFILGLLTVMPLALTIAVVVSMFVWSDSLLMPLFPQGFRGFPGFGILVSLVMILVIGAMTKTVMGTVANAWTDSFFLRVPFARAVYRISKQITSALFSQDSQSSLKRVVRVPFPSEATQALGFVTHTSHDESEVYVFVPTAPNPTGGYVLIYPASKVIDAGIPVDQALQIILSCGAASEDVRHG